MLILNKYKQNSKSRHIGRFIHFKAKVQFYRSNINSVFCLQLNFYSELLNHWKVAVLWFLSLIFHPAGIQQCQIHKILLVILLLCVLFQPKLIWLPKHCALVKNVVTRYSIKVQFKLCFLALKMWTTSPNFVNTQRKHLPGSSIIYNLLLNNHVALLLTSLLIKSPQ